MYGNFLSSNWLKHFYLIKVSQSAQAVFLTLMADSKLSSKHKMLVCAIFGDWFAEKRTACAHTVYHVTVVNIDQIEQNLERMHAFV